VSRARKKLIEVALPLEAINRESAREKSIRHGHPSTLHLWWARRPLAACRAVLFASIVDDPSSRPEEFPTEEDQQRERQRLFRIIEELIKWDNSDNETVLEAARAEIRKATDDNPPPVLDPFCGGGSIPLEAQRLGLEAHASDLNPVAVLITKALVEIPTEFAGRPPVNPESRQKLAYGATWKGAQGLAEDVRYYGKWMREEAFKRIGHLYPKAKLPHGGQATVIAWLWARTVKCPNPACGAQMPLVRSFALSTKHGKEAHVEPIVDREARTVRFDVQSGSVMSEGTVGRRGARCIVCESPVPLEHARSESRAGRMGSRLLAIVAESHRTRTYIAPSDDHDHGARQAVSWWRPSGEIADNPGHTNVYRYGLTEWADLFTSRQLVVLTTFSGLISEVRERALTESGDEEYVLAIATYLAFAVDKMTDTNSTLCTWQVDPPRLRATFGRQALPMTWDFAEANPFGNAAGDYWLAVGSLCEVLEKLPLGRTGRVRQLDATAAVNGVEEPIVCTDPPYYDNIGYADLSDFFYIWLRRSLASVYPDIFSTLLTPKVEELVATPYRFGGDRDRAERFFEEGLRRAFRRMYEIHHFEYPLTFFYAFKQAEAEDGAFASTGWDTMLTGLVGSGFVVTGTWPIRSEMVTRNVGRDRNALTSSIVLVCRSRGIDAGLATRRDFVNALRVELPDALRTLQHGNIAPVDLAQAAIGPGMAIFSRYAKVVEADGSVMTVRTALGLINQALDEILAEQEGDFDADTRFAVTWFEQRRTSEGLYGEADVLARAKNTSVAGMEEAGILRSRAGKVRLLNREELRGGWDPAIDRRLTAWEVAQHLIKLLEASGEDAAADLLRRIGGLGDTARELAYRLYTICERKGWAQEALSYNALVVAWPEIARRVAGTPEAEAQQALEV
jgi:putative DNA methylase